MLRIFRLPKKFSGSDPGLLDPRDWNTLVDCMESLKKEIEQNRPASGPDIGIRQSAGGFVAFLKRRGGGVSKIASGPFCRKYRVPGDTGEPATIFLLGGVVSGGEGNVTVPDIELATVGEEPEDGTHVWLEVGFTAYEEDGVILPGGDVTAVTPGEGSTVPDNIIPTAVALDGTLYISLGSWALGVFTPAGCGNISVIHCIGSLTPQRL